MLGFIVLDIVTLPVSKLTWLSDVPHILASSLCVAGLQSVDDEKSSFAGANELAGHITRRWIDTVGIVSVDRNGGIERIGADTILEQRLD